MIFHSQTEKLPINIGIPVEKKFLSWISVGWRWGTSVEVSGMRTSPREHNHHLELVPFPRGHSGEVSGPI